MTHVIALRKLKTLLNRARNGSQFSQIAENTKQNVLKICNKTIRYCNC